MMAFLVPAGTDLRGEFNEVNPGRDKTSDGWVGDARHAARVSDHNPRGDGSVLALDVDVNGVPMAKIVSFVVGECRAGRETRLQYVIFQRTIWSRSWGWGARAYRGSNPHTAHAHFSFRDGAPGRTFGPWGIAARFANHTPAKPVAAPGPEQGAHKPGSRSLRLHKPLLEGADVAYVQRWIGAERCGKADGIYGPRTVAGVTWYQGMRGLSPDGVVGPKTWRHLGVRYTGGQ